MHYPLYPSALLLTLALGLPAVEQAPDVSEAAIVKLIEKSTAEKPDWWDHVSLNYPQTLDLSCPKVADPSINPRGWHWGIILPNPVRWQEGTKFWHLVLTNAKQNKLHLAAQVATQNLGNCYGDLLQDWPRAIYWYQQAAEKYGRDDARSAAMAKAYWRLGSRTLAVRTIEPLTQDTTRDGSLIILWAELGEYDTAYKLAAERIHQNSEDVGWFVTGYTAQLQGNWAKALDAFTHAQEAPKSNTGESKPIKERAAAAIEAITLFEALDIARINDGVYHDTSSGFSGPVQVDVSVKAHRITDVHVSDHHEKRFYASLKEVPAKIIAKQHVKSVDVCLGATVTSEAIIYATAKALHQGQR